MDQAEEKAFFSGFEPRGFSNWLNLKDFSNAWDAKLQNDLDRFYLLFFTNLNTSEDFARKSSLVGNVFHAPLREWFRWFIGKLSVYLFIFQGKSVGQLEKGTGLDFNEILGFLREHFKEQKVQFNSEMFLEESFLKKGDYHINDVVSDQGDIAKLKAGCNQHPVHSSLEFMLYPEWKNLLEILKEKDAEVGIPKPREKKARTLKSFIVESALVLMSLLVALGLFKITNKFYNKYLSSKIEIYEPNFFWLDKNLTFKSDKKIVRDLNLSLDELDKLVVKEEQDKPFIDENRSTPESEVFVLSSDTIPKDLKYISSQQSKYEEIDKGGFRDKTYGSRKAYRVILNSVESEELGKELTSVVSRYTVREYGKVKPGQKIPGGIYFNLYVAEEHLEKLLGDVANLDQSSRLYVSKTHTSSPAGFEKVFIWIKSI